MAKEDEEVLEFPEDGKDTEEIAKETSEELEKEAEEVMEEIEESSDEGDEQSSKIKELEDRYMYLFAEYENFRKRTAKEKEDLYSSAVLDVTKSWLPVMDNIDRALDAAKDADEKMLQGLELIKKQAQDVLTKLDVKEIECEKGTKFDPTLHEAVMHAEDDSLGENEVAQVFQKGYMCKDRVIRPAVVQVAN